ncbi:hypothetical protein, partial [Neisseria meningitidis]|uniref:hypothetical protein n=4 Tax=Neisseria meningitidis TaxID=487 RepID=UPI001C84A543
MSSNAHFTERSSETHFQTTFFHFPKQEFPPPPQTSPEPVNSPYFNNFLEANHAPYPPSSPVPAPYRRTRPFVFSAGQGSRCPKNFRRALSGLALFAAGGLNNGGVNDGSGCFLYF